MINKREERGGEEVVGRKRLRKPKEGKGKRKEETKKKEIGTEREKEVFDGWGGWG